MRKIILGVAVSLDGFIEGPNGEYDWCFTDQDYGMSEFFKRIDAIFMGRKSYQLTQTMGQQETAGMFDNMKNYVFSNTLDSVTEGNILVKGNLKEEVEKIRNQAGKDIWLFGGSELLSSFLKENLVDEMNLAVHPIVLGRGKPLFFNLEERLKFCLTDTKSYTSGLVSLKYQSE